MAADAGRAARAQAIINNGKVSVVMGRTFHIRNGSKDMMPLIPVGFIHQEPETHGYDDVSLLYTGLNTIRAGFWDTWL